MESTHEPHLETILKALSSKLGTELTTEQVREEFQTLLRNNVPAEAAVRKVLRDHGVVAPPPSANQAPVALTQLPPSGNINVHARILNINEREVTARGETKKIFSGLLGDESGTAPYTSWRDLNGLEKGDVIQVQGAYTKEFRGEISVNFGNNTRIAKVDPESLGRTPTNYKAFKIGDLEERSRNIELEARILELNSREVTVQGETKTLQVGILADDTGKIDFTNWSPREDFEVGKAIKIRGGYLRSFRGTLSINFDERAEVEPVSSDLPDLATLDVAQVVTIGDIMAGKQRRDALIRGAVLQVRDGSGLVVRCGMEGCNRIMNHGECFEHGKQNGSNDMRVKAIVDDGTESIQVIANREACESILGKTLEECVEEARNALRPEIIQERLQELLVGRYVEARGFVREDDYGAMMIARSFEPLHIDVQAHARDLMTSLGVEA